MRIAAILAAALACATARADVVGPAPESCPNGSTPQANHGGPYCDPNECGGDSGRTCATGTTCQAMSLCIVTGTANSHGVEFHFPDVKGSCSGGACATGTCTQVQACTSPSFSATGCGCGSAPAGAGGVGLVLVALLGLAGRRRWGAAG